MKSKPNSKRGIALLFVLGMLTLLLTLAIAFVAVVQLDRKSSLAGVGSVKAEILTDVAVRRAIQIIEANYMESVSGVPGGVHVVNPRNSANPSHLFYNQDGSPNNLFITSTGSGSNVTTEIQQLLGSYNTGNADIDSVASGGLNRLMRANITATAQVPQWIRLGTTDARFCFYANDLSGFANHPVVVDDTVTPPTTTVVPARLPRNFGSDVREIAIPHHDWSHAPANFPLGAYYAGGWNTIADAALNPLIDPDNNKVLRPINLSAVNPIVAGGGSISPTSTLGAQILGAFKTMGKEYQRPNSPLTPATAQLALTALEDYIDADTNPRLGPQNMQTEAHPAINEIGGAVQVVRVRNLGGSTNEWTVRAYAHLETFYSYVEPAPMSAAYQVQASGVGYTLNLDGNLASDQSVAAWSDAAPGYTDMQYRLHRLLPGNDYVEVTHTNTSASLDVSFSVTVDNPSISLGGTVVDNVMEGAGAASFVIAVVNAAVPPTAGILYPASFETTDPRFNWDKATHWGTANTSPADVTLGYDQAAANGPPTLVAKENKKYTSAAGIFRNDRDSGTFVKNGVLATVGELAYLPYAPMQTITVNRRTVNLPPGLPPAVLAALRAGERFHPVWNYFSMYDHQTPQKHFINPNSNHFFYNNGGPSQRTTSFAFKGMKIGPYATPGPDITTVTTAQALLLANELADRPAFGAVPTFTADASKRGYHANVSDIAFHKPLAAVFSPNIQFLATSSMSENMIESYHINSFDLFHTRNNVFALNILISTTHGLRHVFAEVWRDAFAPQGGGWHNSYPLRVTNPSVFN